jgi:Spy/CpxP family protein refolding chaperone
MFNDAYQEITVRKWQVGGILAILFLALTATVYAFNPGGGELGASPGYGGSFAGSHGRMWANLNLSDQQLEKMWQLREKFRTDTQSLRHDLFAKRLEMKSLFTNPSTDEATLMAREKELSGLRQRMLDKMAQFKIEQRSVLTADQIKILAEIPRGRGFGRGLAQRDMNGRGPGFGWR